MTERSRAARLTNRLLPAASKRAFPQEWLDAGDHRVKLLAIAKKRRALDGPRPDPVLGRKWKRATTELRGNALHLLTPKTGSSGRVLFYCHGGAFVIGPSSIEWLFAAKFANAIGCDLALFDYPRVPEVDSATILESTMSAYDAVVERYDVDQLVMAGGSAGGGLAASTLIQLNRLGRDRPPVAALFSPWLDMSVSHPDAESFTDTDLLLPIEQLRRDGELYAGSTELTDPLVSPRFASADDLGALPPVVATAGDQEILLPEAKEFVDGIVAVGGTAHLVVEAHGQHVGVLGPHPEGAQTLAETVDLVRQYL